MDISHCQKCKSTFIEYIYFQNKIHQLEEKLREERHHRKLMQEKTAEVNILDGNL
jgi:hypothetical protein